MKVSFDFDDTLSRPSIQRYAKELIATGAEVWIVTTRWDARSKLCSKDYYDTHGDTWTEVNKKALELGIPLKRVIFTCYQWKVTFFEKNLDFLWHLDDNGSEFKTIRALGISVVDSYHPKWKITCNKLIKDRGTVDAQRG